MMNLHTDKATFNELINRISDDLSIEPDIIEKDYYVTLILQEFVLLEPNIVFKGGTSLSKGYHLIDRFSEDIDLNYLAHDELTRGKKKSIKRKLVKAVENCSLQISNLDETRSNRVFKRYIIEYEKNFARTTPLKSAVTVEMAFQEESYPIEKRSIQSIIQEYLIEHGFENICRLYEMQSFSIKIQSYVRTFI